MKHLLTLLLLPASVLFSFAQSNDYYAYVNKYKDIAISEMERAGVPASIKLAQGLLESGGGTSYLARKGNNHFGVKCGRNWTGKKLYRKDDDYDSNGKLMESCFRAYKNAEASYIAHSDFLRDNPRYDFLFRLNPYDYKRWAHGLKKAGYATSATYAQKLIKVIETYDLSQYDQMNANDVIVDESETYQEKLQGITQNNDVKLVLARDGETPRLIADRTKISVNKILRYNEALIDANQRLGREERVYLQPKRNAFRGTKKFHYVQAGESLYDVAQLYGVTEDKLRSRNRIPDEREPAFGEKLKLRGWKISKSQAVKTSGKVNRPAPVIAEPVIPNRDNTDPDPRPTGSNNDNPTNSDNGVNDRQTEDGLPVITGGRRPVLTSDTGERDEDFYPPPPADVPIEPEVPISQPDPVYNSPNDNNSGNTDPDPAPINNAQYHTVAAGDTLYNISRRYGLSVQQLMNLNGLTNTVIRRGQQLRVR